MAIVDVWSGLYSFNQQGTFGIPGGFGRVRCGWSEFGYYEPRAGYYQKRRLKKGPGYCRLRHYWPKNPQTVEQQANRQRFADAISAWRLLTPEEVKLYNKLGRYKRYTGFNYYISEYMKGRII